MPTDFFGPALAVPPPVPPLVVLLLQAAPTRATTSTTENMSLPRRIGPPLPLRRCAHAHRTAGRFISPPSTISQSSRGRPVTQAGKPGPDLLACHKTLKH